LTLLFIGITTQDKLKQDFVPEFLEMTIGDGISLSDTFQMQLVNALIISQTQLIDTTLAFDEFKTFQTNSDIAGLTLKAKLEGMKLGLSNDSTKELALSKLKEQKIDLGKEIISKIPLIEQVSSYAWLIYAIGGYTTFIMIGGILIKNLSAILYRLLFLIFPKIHTFEENAE
jgi:hypothetical protein